MNLKEKIIDKIDILKRNPRLFAHVIKNVVKTRLGLFPKTPKEGNRFSTDLEVKTLQKYACIARVGIVEVGVLDGLTTREMAKVAQAPIYGIDPIIPDSMNERLIGNEEKIKQNLNFYPKFYFFKDYSFNVVKNWRQPFDFIFIDGDHTYEAVRQDFLQWFPLLQSGGTVAFHDSAPVTSTIPGGFIGWPGPIKLVAELKNSPALEFLEVQDSLSVFRKK
ncbi:MAG: class I SAM-dependent methyltransferase [Patescibacteria group bacterium]|nr:class I SAM-dependent methyltransferase [Patescibacteria group bacterium]